MKYSGSQDIESLLLSPVFHLLLKYQVCPQGYEATEPTRLSWHETLTSPRFSSWNLHVCL